MLEGGVAREVEIGPAPTVSTFLEISVQLLQASDLVASKIDWLYVHSGDGVLNAGLLHNVHTHRGSTPALLLGILYPVSPSFAGLSYSRSKIINGLSSSPVRPQRR